MIVAPRTTASLNDELDAPVKMSLTGTVPALVPSLFQSSSPLLPSVAEK